MLTNMVAEKIITKYLELKTKYIVVIVIAKCIQCLQYLQTETPFAITNV